jgi:hypothetical protein
MADQLDQWDQYHAEWQAQAEGEARVARVEAERERAAFGAALRVDENRAAAAARNTERLRLARLVPAYTAAKERRRLRRDALKADPVAYATACQVAKEHRRRRRRAAAMPAGEEVPTFELLLFEMYDH